MSNNRKTTVERAFEFGASGRVDSISDLRPALDGEGHNSSRTSARPGNMLIGTNTGEFRLVGQSR